MEDIVTGSVLQPASSREDVTVTGSVETGAENSNVTTKGESSVFQQSSDDLGKQEFLNLLITSLRHQDPLDPTSNEQFISQMAQFSSLEAAQNTNKSIGQMADNLEKLINHQSVAANTMSGAASTNLLGKNVRIGHGEFDYVGQPVKFNVHVDEDEIGFLSVVNEENEVVNVVEMIDTQGNIKDGDFIGNVWDGTKADGSKADPGKYHFEVTTKDGSRDVGYAFMESVVTGISYTPEGTMLNMNGEEHPFEDIIYVSNNSAHVSANTTDNNNEAQEEAVEQVDPSIIDRAQSILGNSK